MASRTSSKDRVDVRTESKGSKTSHTLQRRSSSKLKSLPVCERMLMVLPRIGLASDGQLEHLAALHGCGGNKAMQALLNLMCSGIEDGVIWSQDVGRGDFMGSVTGFGGDRLDLAEPIPMPPTAGCDLLHTEGTLEAVLSVLQQSVNKIANEVAESTEPLAKLAVDTPRQICVLIQRVRFTTDMEKCLIHNDRDNKELGKLVKSLTEIKDKLTEQLVRAKEIPEREQSTLMALQIALHEQLDVTRKLIDQKKPEDVATIWKEQFLKFWHDPKEGTFTTGFDRDKVIRIGDEYSPPTLLVTTDFTHNLRWAYLNAMSKPDEEGGNRLFGLVGPTGSGKTALLCNIGQLLGTLPTVIRASEDTSSDEKYWHRKFFAAKSTSGRDTCGRMTPIIISKAQRLSENTVIAMLKVASELQIALCLTMEPGQAAEELQKGILEGHTIINTPEPDLKVIAAGQLAAEGLQQSDNLAEPLASLLVSLRKECSEQAHYDFGPRTLIQLCTQIGIGRRKDKDEMSIVTSVAERCLLPRLVKDDVEKLQKLLCSNFPEHFKADKTLSSPSTSSNRWSQVAENILSITVIEPDCMVLPVPETKEFFEEFCRALNRTGTPLERMSGKLCDIKADELLGIMPKKAGDVAKDGVLVELLRKTMEDHPPDQASKVWVAIETGDCRPEQWEGLFELLNDSGRLNLATGEQMRLAPNLRFLFVMPGVGSTATETFSRAAVVWTDPTS